ncbi:MAG: redoxin domain-containing protein [Syntrophales bacterium]|nr:redoxin domain-containing protein [Syntrophales bacterium]
MAEKTLIQLGKKVPNFTLKDQNGADFTLSGCVGKKVLLSFHPLAWTGICADQMKSLEKNRKKIEAAGAVAVGISVDSVPCKTAGC